MNVVVRKFVGARQRLNPRPPKSPPLLSQRGVVVRALPALSEPPPDSWQEHCANEPSPLHCFGEKRALWTLAAKVTLLFLLAIVSLSAPAAVREVGAIGLTVGDLDRTLEFYTGVLPFEKVSELQSLGSGANNLLGLNVTKLRSAELKLGDERITLTEHLANKGRPIPRDSRSFDHWFQHIAIVVSDMDRAYDHLRRHRVKHVSTAPQTLPAWNKDAGGIKAFYFRDPEDHALEIIWFPPGKGDPKWGRPSTNLFLGIDHTAIVVSDTARSLAFYHESLGFRVAGGAENYGVEQEHLNQVFGARLRITALRAERGPGIEFLEYIAPPDGRPLPDDAMPNDLVFWHTKLAVDGIEDFAAKLREQQTRFVSTSIVALPGGSSAARSVIVRDPDGHALQFIEEPTSLAEK